MSLMLAKLAAAAHRAGSQAALEAGYGIASKANGVSIAAVKAGVNPNDVRHGAEGARLLVTARREALYFSVAFFNQPLRAISRVAGMSPEGVRKACHAVEQRREVSSYDRWLDELELELMA